MIRSTRSLLAVLAFFAIAASGQSFPAKPVHIVVSMPAGGTADPVARAIADALVADWRQPVIVENKPW